MDTNHFAQTIALLKLFGQLRCWSFPSLSLSVLATAPFFEPATHPETNTALCHAKAQRSSPAGLDDFAPLSGLAGSIETTS